MKNYLLVLPIALLVAYSQVVVKWHTGTVVEDATIGFPRHLLRFLTDPVILSAYAAALIASFAWLYVVTKLHLTVAFPIYIGVTFVMVLLGGWLFLSESLTTTKLVAVFLILSGIVLGVASDA
jgi:multidrug transporter EmrE-like cation transporter